MMEDLSLHILDIAENSVAAGASRLSIAVNENERRDILTIIVSDDGRGMSPEEMERALDPFYTTKGKATGLGLPFLAMAAEQSGGRLRLASTPGAGTRVVARFRHGHVDRPPLTKMAETVMMLVFGHPEVAIRFRQRRNGRDFRFDSRRFVAPGGGTAVSASAVAAVREALANGLRSIGAL